MLKKLNRLKIIFLIASILCGGGIAYYYYQQQKITAVPAAHILEFNEARDMQDILDLFRSNWYWLVSSKDYDPEFMLKQRAPGKYEPEYIGKLHIKVLRDDESFKGFVAYYKKSFYLGQLLFVAVKPEFRGRGYAQQLVKYALDDFKKMGVLRVKLVTRPSNHAAQAVYKKLGFKETKRDDTFVYFEKWFNNSDN